MAGFWSVTRWADVDALTKDWQTFSSERGGVLLAEYDEAARDAWQATIAGMAQTVAEPGA